jgi:hypothetical protein
VIDAGNDSFYSLFLLLYEKIHDLCKSLDIFRVGKCRWLRWAEQVADVGKKRSEYRMLLSKPVVKVYL